MEVDQEYFHGDHGHKRHKRSSQLDEYIDNLNEDLNRDEAYQELMADPWLWWLKVGRSKYPILFKMAVDFLSIPSTSCECERCFSTAGRTITERSKQPYRQPLLRLFNSRRTGSGTCVVECPLIKLSDYLLRKEASEVFQRPIHSIHSIHSIRVR